MNNFFTSSASRAIHFAKFSFNGYFKLLDSYQKQFKNKTNSCLNVVYTTKKSV